MEDISRTIDAYRESCALLEQRINALNREINRLKHLKLPLGSLPERRYVLYAELSDMQYAIRQLRDYRQSAGRGSARPSWT